MLTLTLVLTRTLPLTPHQATEAGTISHEKQPGSIINQGDLLSSLTLKDPSKVTTLALLTLALALTLLTQTLLTQTLTLTRSRRSCRTTAY